MRKVNQNEDSKARRLLYLIAVNIDVACSGIKHNLATFVHFHFDLFIVLFDIDPGQCLHHGAQIQRSAELVQLPMRAPSLLCMSVPTMRSSVSVSTTWRRPWLAKRWLRSTNKAASRGPSWTIAAGSDMDTSGTEEETEEWTGKKRTTYLEARESYASCETSGLLGSANHALFFLWESICVVKNCS